MPKPHEEVAKLVEMMSRPTIVANGLLQLRVHLAEFASDYVIFTRNVAESQCNINLELATLARLAIEALFDCGHDIEFIFRKIAEERSRQREMWRRDDGLLVEDWILILEDQLRQATAKRLDECVRPIPQDACSNHLISGSFEERLMKFATVCFAALENRP